MAAVIITQTSFAVVGVVVAGAILVGIAKLFLSLGETAVKSVEKGTAKQELDGNYTTWKKQCFIDFDRYINEIYKNSKNVGILELTIDTEEIMDLLKDKIAIIFGIEIYDNSIFADRTIGELRELLGLQLDRYDLWGKT